MKSILIIFGLLGGLVVVSTTDASAAVCDRGVYRAGCVGPCGAVAVRRPIVAPRAAYIRRGVYVGPRF
jgi:hypothetical protein